MFQKLRIIGAGLIVLASAGAGIVAAQQPQTGTPGTVTVQERRAQRSLKDRAMRRRMRHRALGGLRQLGLTEQQRQQAKELRRAGLESNKAQREELRQLLSKRRDGATLSDADMARARELRNQLQESRMRMRAQMSTILTAEQKAKLDEMIKNRRENRQRFGRRGQTNRTIQ